MLGSNPGLYIPVDVVLVCKQIVCRRHVGDTPLSIQVPVVLVCTQTAVEDMLQTHPGLFILVPVVLVCIQNVCKRHAGDPHWSFYTSTYYIGVYLYNMQNVYWGPILSSLYQYLYWYAHKWYVEGMLENPSGLFMPV